MSWLKNPLQILFKLFWKTAVYVRMQHKYVLVCIYILLSYCCALPSRKCMYICIFFPKFAPSPQAHTHTHIMYLCIRTHCNIRSYARALTQTLRSGQTLSLSELISLDHALILALLLLYHRFRFTETSDDNRYKQIEKHKIPDHHKTHEIKCGEHACATQRGVHNVA